MPSHWITMETMETYGAPDVEHKDLPKSGAACSADHSSVRHWPGAESHQPSSCTMTPLVAHTTPKQIVLEGHPGVTVEHLTQVVEPTVFSSQKGEDSPPSSV